MRLTESIVRAATREKYGKSEIPDDTVPGLILRLRDSGSKKFIVRSSIDGDRKSVTLGSPDKGMTLADARKRAMEELANGLQPRVKPQAPPTLTDMMEQWEKSEAPRHGEQYRRDTRRYWKKFIQPAFGENDLRQIDRPDVREWFLNLDASETTANRAHSAIQKLFTLAVEKRHINYNPAANMKKHVEDARTRVFTIDEVTDVLDAIHAHEADRPIAANALRCALMISARIGEVQKLKHAQFDFEQGVWHLPASMRKTKNEVVAPLSPHFAEFIKSRPRWSETFVFPSPKDPEKPVRYEVIRDLWHLVRPDTDAHIHDFRRTIATNALSAGMNIIGIQKMLGHKNFATTAKSYLHPETGERDIMQKYHDTISAGIFGPGDEA
ncbi:hypothetical protein A3731_10320 [Roseovarius sp. HI0049]|nr:hypothetical protein A3731_10320 [Roseovarius sp. HI0049]